MNKTDKKSLFSLVTNNSDFEQLQRLLHKFNIFEALGAVKQELRHSDFLAFLLDPRQNHGLSDEFVRLLLSSILKSSQFPFKDTEIKSWNFNEIEVYREWRNIDILLIDSVHRFVIIIENKILASEHSNQLQRYYQTVKNQYPDFEIINIFLTPDGETPSDDTYIPLDYTSIYEIITNLIRKRNLNIPKDLKIFMMHYTEMLRRHIMPDSEIAELCRQIYKNHKRAIDLIIEHRPNQQTVVREIVENLINETPNLRLDSSAKGGIRFAPEEWYIPEFLHWQDWVKSGQILLFEFRNRIDDLHLCLYIGPGPEELRKALFSLALKNPNVFRCTKKSLGQKHNSIYGRKFLSPRDYIDAQPEDLEMKIKKVWNQFITTTLPQITHIIKKNQKSWKLKQTIVDRSNQPK